ncbi:hypothetical protein [Rhodoferax sp. BLA1]|uniref:hypothetical protein n=1 Tax=Rhodoferax sp. BLA1 TaxID=2576062 RepID=UPI0015D0FCC2|nr:hypothetical protein [Rhodoferax sp. BLA1]
MPPETPTSSDLSQIMHSIGKLTGEVRAMHEGTTARIEDIRRDIARLEQAGNERMNRTEQALSTQIREQGEHFKHRVDGIDKRVKDLEAEDKRLIEKVAKVSAMGGGISGALIAGAVEAFKHIGN